ncbi:MAG: acyltransferase [Terracidiphilus sp.]|jgi:peptidoglycan/LPS O-acetylase OafA/YrhL
MSTAGSTLGAPVNTPLTAKYNYAIGYLRAFIVALVVAHHAALAYHSYAPPPPASLLAQPRWWGAFPIVDPQKWSGASLLVGFNDIFFMSLMFFLSGLFVWHGLAKKGAATFLRDRLFRLGLPFIVAAGILAPVAYYPTWLQISGHSDIAGYWHQWRSLGYWPTGPAWFIWVLFAFDCIAALLFVLAPQWGLKLGTFTTNLARRPVVFFAALVAITALVYLPMAHYFTSLAWTAIGPFAFQTSRILHYLVYFLTGVAVGAAGLDQGLLAPQGKLARSWPWWIARSLLFFAVATSLTLAVLTGWSKSPALTVAADVGFVFSCAASCFAFLALFLRFAQTRSSVCDSLAANSYAIYLIHYVFVIWLQYALLPASIPGVAKFLIVFSGALFLSWATSATLRRIPAVARII